LIGPSRNGVILLQNGCHTSICCLKQSGSRRLRRNLIGAGWNVGQVLGRCCAASRCLKQSGGQPYMAPKYDWYRLGRSQTAPQWLSRQHLLSQTRWKPKMAPLVEKKRNCGVDVRSDASQGVQSHRSVRRALRARIGGLPDSRAAPEVPRPASTARISVGGASESFASAGIIPVGPESDQIRDPQGIGAQPFASAGIIPVGPESDQNRDPQGIGVQSFAPQISEPTTSVTNNSRT
jgi:hypothetical protein